jgi:hypothetical protein
LQTQAESRRRNPFSTRESAQRLPKIASEQDFSSRRPDSNRGPLHTSEGVRSNPSRIKWLTSGLGGRCWFDKAASQARPRGDPLRAASALNTGSGLRAVRRGRAFALRGPPRSRGDPARAALHRTLPASGRLARGQLPHRAAPPRRRLSRASELGAARRPSRVLARVRSRQACRGSSTYGAFDGPRRKGL